MRSYPPPETNSISVVIPAYNAEARIHRCLDALKAQTVPPEEIIVVDDGSEDETAQRAERLGARVIRQPNAGPAAARNRGAREATGELLLFTDDDCAPAPDWIRELAAPFDDSEVVGAKGTYRSEQSALVARWVQLEYAEKYERMAEDERIDFIDTYAAAYRRAVFLAAGGFDESFPSATVEDQEFSFRLAEQGHKLVFAPSAVVAHEHPATVGAYVRRKFLIGVWKRKVLERFPSKAVNDSHTPQALKLQVLLAGLVSALLPFAPFSSRSRRIILLAGTGFAISGASTVRLAASKDPSLAPAVPALLMVRALALGFGLARGLVRR